jgi:hypothetical protein
MASPAMTTSAAPAARQRATVAGTRYRRGKVRLRSVDLDAGTIDAHVARRWRGRRVDSSPAGLTDGRAEPHAEPASMQDKPDEQRAAAEERSGPCRVVVVDLRHRS